MQYSYLIVDDDAESTALVLSLFESFPEYFCVGVVTGHDDAINKILDLQPNLVFLDPDPKSNKSTLSLSVVTSLYQYIDTLPHFIVLTNTKQSAYDAMKAGVTDYLLKPLDNYELKKSLLRFKKGLKVVSSADNVDAVDGNNTICIKSYSDYQFIALNDIVYLKADNNTTDFYLVSGRKLTAYKTLKHYELNLPLYFSRIHNSYIVNINHITRIHIGKSLCYLNNNDVSISFSKTFKDNIDAIIRRIAPDNI